MYFQNEYVLSRKENVNAKILHVPDEFQNVRMKKKKAKSKQKL